ncbi:MAG: hypothetical protein DWQ19_11740 [Crenarchaeota archaeon]|nr:MAG: hypothetical protein DWQ19_11740 [Thermoproteota archaeon]
MNVNLNERQLLIQKIKYLMEKHDKKSQDYQRQNGLNSEYGCITRESCVMASLVSQMQQLGITFDECRR